MLLSIKEMEVRKLPFEQTWEPGEIEFDDSGIRQAGPLVAEGVAELLPNTGNEVRIKGNLKVAMTSECDRCLGRAVYPIDAPFDLFYRPLKSVDAGEDEIALDEGEAEMGFYEMPGLVLEEILREQVMLLLPMQRVCKPECKGICPVCGANRNETECRCETHPADDRWSALKDIHVQGNEK